FDTGASVTVIDSGWAATHGLKTEGRMQAAGAGAAGGASFATLGTLRVASAANDGVELKDVKVAVLDVDPSFQPMFWRSMAGVIGYDVISRFVVTVNYDDSVLVLHDPATWTYAGTEKPLPMVMNGTVPALEGKFDDADKGLFRLDVGSSSTVDVHAPFAKKTGIVNRMGKTTRFDGVGFGGSFTSEVGRLRSMSLGPYEWDDPVVVVSHATEGAFASEEFAGNIGNRILERFRVTFDYERRQIYLEPGRHYADRDHLTRAGVLLTRRAGRVGVESVLDKSPADHAGLRPGDQVLSVDGRDIAEWDLPEISALFDEGEVGRKVPLRVLRGGQEKQLRMKLAEVVR
ncbi:MAG TPA: aspartyl protease family protein, partial [Methylomirabilota bacterium]|nr:aspartyl protease family protein [Methylomirabilota bacterium]